MFTQELAQTVCRMQILLSRGYAAESLTKISAMVQCPYMKAIVTGSGGLIGSECARMLCAGGWDVIGIDNDMHARFFGLQGTTDRNVMWLRKAQPRYRHFGLDIRDRQGIRVIVERNVNSA